MKMTYNFNGKTITLKTEPDLGNYLGDAVYSAFGTDDDGIEYKVIFEITEEYKNGSDDYQSDEGNACDWDNPTKIILI